jgi:hypothetical protein
MLVALNGNNCHVPTLLKKPNRLISFTYKRVFFLPVFHIGDYAMADYKTGAKCCRVVGSTGTGGEVDVVMRVEREKDSTPLRHTPRDGTRILIIRKKMNGPLSLRSQPCQRESEWEA